MWESKTIPGHKDPRPGHRGAGQQLLLDLLQVEKRKGELCGLSHCSWEQLCLLPVFELCSSDQRGLGTALGTPGFPSNREM